ncbi:hypothetical protein J437_LFUL019048 [Ladona fulva]|uniref:C2H2-type domain-containing protein n=1 Tax=Ladona fulva TaxID=123851 RepID=A0A8K0P6N2_LADFU|nr:hypothetical protein J437_LFUL019048 [Ladona fulva]
MLLEDLKSPQLGHAIAADEIRVAIVPGNLKKRYTRRVIDEKRAKFAHENIECAGNHKSIIERAATLDVRKIFSEDYKVTEKKVLKGLERNSVVLAIVCGAKSLSGYHDNVIQNAIIPEMKQENPLELNLHQCDVCRGVFLGAGDLIEHKHLFHEVKDGFRCGKCHRLFKSAMNLERHVDKYSFGCKSKVGANFKGEGENYVHVTSSSAPESPKTSEGVNKDSRYCCDKCDSCFGSRKAMKTHLKQTHCSEFTCVCGVCNRGFVSRPDLELHKRVHTKEYSCKGCKSEFLTLANFKRHLRFCQGKTPRHKCQICGREISRKCNLLLHLRTHSLVKKFKCHLCPKKYHRSFHLYTHIRSIHLKQRPHECGICQRSFSCRRNLVVHLSLHSDERPYACSFCYKKFKTQNVKRLHEIRVHNMIKPQKVNIIVDEKNLFHEFSDCFRCGKCYRLFKSAKRLERHVEKYSFGCKSKVEAIFKGKCENYVRVMSSSAPESPKTSEGVNKDAEFCCDKCDSCFRSRIALKTHLKQTHSATFPCICGVCNRGFLSRIDLELHKHVHVKEYSCEMCKMQFLTMENYKVHLRLCHGKSSAFKCQICGREAYTKGNFNLHLDTHSLVKKFECRVCHTKHNDVSRLNAHMRSVHLKQKPHKCDVCQRGFSFRSHLVVHFAVHSDARPFKCSVCDKTFKTKIGRRIHERKVHKFAKYEKVNAKSLSGIRDNRIIPEMKQEYTLESNLHQCNVCRAVFLSAGDLIDHKHLFHKFSDGFRCGKCYRLFKSPKRLERHVEKYSFACKSKVGATFRGEFDNSASVTSSVAPESPKTSEGVNKDTEFCCDKCDSCFGSRFTLKTHLKQTHSAMFPCICGVCNLGFASRQELELHKHVHQKEYSCEDCKTEFLTVRNLKRHLRYCQGRAHIHKCQICGKEASQKCNLRLHLQTHSLVKKFECNICHKKQNYMHQLYDHMRYVHPKQKPHKCGICRKSFSVKKSLVVHLTKHSDERPFRCSACDKTFKTKGVRRDHEKRVHKLIKPQKVNIIVDEKRLERHVEKYSFACKSKVEAIFKGKCENYVRVMSSSASENPKTSEGVNKDAEFCCDKCDSCFGSRITLKTHLKQTHSATLACVCGVCNRGFPSWQELELHKCIHTKEYSCKDCKTEFLTVRNLKRHLSYCQGRAGVHKCQICGREVYTKLNFNLHLETHSLVKKFECRVCHTKHKDVSRLNAHMRSVHLKQKPHKCDVCQRAFSSRSHLVVHFAVHSDARPFKCSVCDKTFKIKIGRRVHERRVHKFAKYEKVNLIVDERILEEIRHSK